MELLPLVCLCLLSCSGDAVRVLVEEGSDAVLPCLIRTKRNLAGNAFHWKKDEQKEVFMYDAGLHHNNGRMGQDKQFRGRVSFFYDQLQNGNASIKIHETKMADSGTYSCDFPGLQPSQTSIIRLVVDPVLKDRTGENIPGAAPEPIIRTLYDTEDSSLLQCEAHGDPLPTLKWEDSDDNTLPAEEPQTSERGGRLYVSVTITVTKTDNYRCVATQMEISHQVAAETSVNIQGEAPEPVWLIGWIVAGVLGFLLLVVVGWRYKKRRDEKKKCFEMHYAIPIPGELLHLECSRQDTANIYADIYDIMGVTESETV